MDPPSLNREHIVRRAENAAVAVLCLLVLILQTLRLLSHAPFYDETLHVRFIWLLSTGMKPEADYFCQYPVLAYICTLPFVKLLPESAYWLLALRGLSMIASCLLALLFYRRGKDVVGNGAAGLLPFLLIVAAGDNGAFLAEYSIDHFAALAAIGALVLILRPSGPVGLGMACGLAVLSVAFTPKYILPLSFGILGAAVAAVLAPTWRRKGALLAAAVLGGLAAVSIVALLYWLANISIADNFRYSHVLMSRFKLDTQHQQSPMTLSTLLATFVLQHVVLTAVLVSGVVFWACRVRRERPNEWLPGAGVMLGLAAFTLAWKHLSAEQYMAPILLSTALFAPYSFPSSPDYQRHGRVGARLLKWARWSLFVLVGMTISFEYFRVAGEFREPVWNVRSTASIGLRGDATARTLVQPPLLKTLRFYQTCLALIPKGERVVATEPYHPLLRMDLTWVTFDERPSLSQFMSPDDRARAEFSPQAFRAALEKNPPAYIALHRLDSNYPPGWEAVCRDFLHRRASEYEVFDVDNFGNTVAVRKDLVHDSSTTAAQFKEAVEIEGKDVLGFVALGDGLLKQGETDRAIASFRSALEINPEDAVAHIRLGVALSNRGQNDEAIAHCKKALQICPEDMRGFVQMFFGDVVSEQGKPREAAEHYQDALRSATAHNYQKLADSIREKLKHLQPDAPQSQSP
jgi:tetratricopeptide (TPR) repeat protein